MKKVTSFEGFDIYFKPEKEFESMRTHFTQECGWSNKEYKDLASSKPKWFMAHVIAMKGGVELGESFLGGCCYQSYAEFYTEYFDLYFRDMMVEAVEEAKSRLPDVLNGFKKQAASLSKTIQALEIGYAEPKALL